MSVRLGVGLPGPFSVSFGGSRGRGGNFIGTATFVVLYACVWVCWQIVRLSLTLGIFVLDTVIAGYDNRRATRNV